MRISGHTRILAHIGVPTESFTAPLIYNPWFEHAGVDAVVMPMGCEAGDFAGFLPLVARLRNFAGALITMPHKTTVVTLLDDASPAVRLCGACNAVRRDEAGMLVGDMFDGEGFVRAVKAKNRRIEGGSALVIGTGGVGSAIAASLALAGVARLGVHDSDEARAIDLAGRLAAHCPGLAVETGSADPAGWDIVVNATPLGMKPGDPMPVDPARLSPQSLVAEVVLSPAVTPLIEAARARGCDTQLGTDMLFEQIPAYLEFFGLPSTDAGTLRRLATLP